MATIEDSRGDQMSERSGSVLLNRLRVPRNVFPWLVLAPVLLYYFVFLIYPILYAIWVSLHLWIIEDPNASSLYSSGTIAISFCRLRASWTRSGTRCSMCLSARLL